MLREVTSSWPHGKWQRLLTARRGVSNEISFIHHCPSFLALSCWVFYCNLGCCIFTFPFSSALDIILILLACYGKLNCIFFKSNFIWFSDVLWTWEHQFVYFVFLWALMYFDKIFDKLSECALESLFMFNFFRILKASGIGFFLLRFYLLVTVNIIFPIISVNVRWKVNFMFIMTIFWKFLYRLFWYYFYPFCFLLLSYFQFFF